MTVHAPPVPRPRFAHLLAMSDAIGTFEHAEHAVPRRQHGYCTDDMARVLMVILREPFPSPQQRDLGRTAMRFLVAAQDVVGRSRNRRTVDGRWHGPASVEDCWGRSAAAFGLAARRGDGSWMRQMGAAAFGHASQQRSHWLRPMAFAALGASEVLASDPQHGGARSMLVDAAELLGRPGSGPAWPWPEPRLAYANAVIAEALVAAGHGLARPEVVGRGLELLEWLLDRQTIDGHLSPIPVGGAGPADHGPSFDQQPIEVAALADACARAYSVTDDPGWLRGVDLSIAWFLGDNDCGSVMWDPVTGGGYDGLHARGANRNQGAESTLALISTLQHGRARVLAP